MHPEDVDALLIMSFGGPEHPDEILPFLRHVVAGRNVPDERLEQVAEQYRHFGGVSPLNEENRALVRRLQAVAPPGWLGDRVYFGNRNSAPFVADTLARMSADGVTRAAVFITSAFSSYSGCRQYRENLYDGRAASGTEIELLPLARFHDHPLFCDIWADRLAAVHAPGDRVLFVTHSLPVAAAQRYLPQHERLAAAIAAMVAARGGTGVDWRLGFQSRSGPPQQPWLEPDIGELVTQAAADAVPRVVVVPIGFLAENLEIRWDLDVTAGALAQEAGVGYVRLEPPQTDERFVALVLDLFGHGDGFPCRESCCPNPRGPRPSVGERPDE